MSPLTGNPAKYGRGGSHAIDAADIERQERRVWAEYGELYDLARSHGWRQCGSPVEFLAAKLDIAQTDTETVTVPRSALQGLVTALENGALPWSSQITRRHLVLKGQQHVCTLLRCLHSDPVNPEVMHNAGGVTGVDPAGDRLHDEPRGEVWPVSSNEVRP